MNVGLISRAGEHTELLVIRRRICHALRHGGWESVNSNLTAVYPGSGWRCHTFLQLQRLIFDAERGNVCSAAVYLGYCENTRKFAILLAFPNRRFGEVAW